MKQGGDIAIRMFEYDMNIALVHRLEWVEIAQAGNTYKHRLKFPKSAILYLDNTKKTPDAESCVIAFPRRNGVRVSYPHPENTEVYARNDRRKKSEYSTSVSSNTFQT